MSQTMSAPFVLGLRNSLVGGGALDPARIPPGLGEHRHHSPLTPGWSKLSRPTQTPMPPGAASLVRRKAVFLPGPCLGFAPFSSCRKTPCRVGFPTKNRWAVGAHTVGWAGSPHPSSGLRETSQKEASQTGWGWGGQGHSSGWGQDPPRTPVCDPQI